MLYNLLIKNNNKLIFYYLKTRRCKYYYYFKHITLHKLPWIETHENLISTKLNIYCTVLLLYYNSKQNIPYNWPTGYQQVLSSICII